MVEKNCELFKKQDGACYNKTNESVYELGELSSNSYHFASAIDILKNVFLNPIDELVT